MALPKKGSRTIVVNDIEYRWLIRKKPTYMQAVDLTNMSAVVELSEFPKCSLLIEFDFPRPDNWLETNHKSITPKDIAACIINSLNLGWQPDQSGKAFSYKYGQET